MDKKKKKGIIAFVQLLVYIVKRIVGFGYVTKEGKVGRQAAVDG